MVLFLIRRVNNHFHVKLLCTSVTSHCAPSYSGALLSASLLTETFSLVLISEVKLSRCCISCCCVAALLLCWTFTQPVPSQRTTPCNRFLLSIIQHPFRINKKCKAVGPIWQREAAFYCSRRLCEGWRSAFFILKNLQLMSRLTFVHLEALLTKMDSFRRWKLNPKSCCCRCFFTWLLSK